MCTKKVLFVFWVSFIGMGSQAQLARHNLVFDKLAKTWDEGMPLGNGMLGALVWEKEGRLRFSLDRADVWDNRPMKGLHRDEFRFKWVEAQVRKKDYGVVQRYFDWPYDNEPAPTKIPCAALEFHAGNLGPVHKVELNIATAVCEVHWQSGVRLQAFVHATAPEGWFRFTGLQANIDPVLVPPKYEGEVKVKGDPVGGDDLTRLGYKQGKVEASRGSLRYLQEGWGGFQYMVTVQWTRKDDTLEGIWTVQSAMGTIRAADLTANITSGFDNARASHQLWWSNYWKTSAISVPDERIEKQWYLEQYKFGSASRRGAPPISLQAVWTADNGRIPPWKGDYHHDLNTQLSYWPAYSGNRLEDGLAYLDHLDANKDNYRRYTRQYFEVAGLNVPGVTTIDGTEMGGWIQYSLSPTVSAWLAQHYYLHWRYSMDRNFLRDRAWPWLKETAVFLESITRLDANGKRQLPISSSPEIKDNSLAAWFDQTTNYDLALIKYVFEKAGELATEMGLPSEASHWRKVLAELPAFSLSPAKALNFAPTLPYAESHRHFSHLMAIHPLGLIRWEDGENSRSIIRSSLQLLDSIGPAAWCGYSYAWEANLKARARDGEGAAKALDIFAKAFCLPNSFHVNGDQTKSGYSRFTYRPFTLEGNFAFAAGLQEMLLQSYAGFIEIMPAVPAHWKDISFAGLRTEGACIVDAWRKDGQVARVKLVAEQGGKLKLKLPFARYTVTQNNGFSLKRNGDILTMEGKPGAVLILEPAS